MVKLPHSDWFPILPCSPFMNRASRISPMGRITSRGFGILFSGLGEKMKWTSVRQQRERRMSGGKKESLPRQTCLFRKVHLLIVCVHNSWKNIEKYRE